jgi:hypothetical protein
MHSICCLGMRLLRCINVAGLRMSPHRPSSLLRSAGARTGGLIPVITRDKFLAQYPDLPQGTCCFLLELGFEIGDDLSVVTEAQWKAGAAKPWLHWPAWLRKSQGPSVLLYGTFLWDPGACLTECDCCLICLELSTLLNYTSTENPGCRTNTVRNVQSLRQDSATDTFAISSTFPLGSSALFGETSSIIRKMKSERYRQMNITRQEIGCILFRVKTYTLYDRE